MKGVPDRSFAGVKRDLAWRYRDRVRVTVTGGGGGGGVWGGITGTLSDQTDLQSALDTAATTAVWGGITGTLADQTDLSMELGLLAPLASPTFTGTAIFNYAGSLVAGTLPEHYMRFSDLAGTVEIAAIGLILAGKQDIDATLTALAGVATAADKLVYATGVDTFTTTDLTPFARTILDDANASAVRGTIGAAASGVITAAGLTQAAAGLVGGTAAGTVTVMTFAAVQGQLSTFNATTNGLVPTPGSPTGLVLSDNGTWISFPIPVPPDGSVTTAKLADGSVTVPKALAAIRRVTALRL